MNYTTEPGATVEDFAADRRATLLAHTANLALDAEMISFCVALRELAGVDPDPDLHQAQADNAASLKAAKRDIAALSKKIPKKRGAAAKAEKEAAAEARAAELVAHVARIEAEHRAHEVLAEVEADPEPHLIAMLTIEGSHAAALAELEQLLPA